MMEFIEKMKESLQWLAGYSAGLRDVKLDNKVDRMFKLNKRLANSFLPKGEGE